MNSLLHVRLMGVLALTDAAGRDVTPRGAKARALVALLAMTADHRRPRRWIEGKLWSDRGPDQASGSLRQVLVELRGALGPASGALVAEREMIGMTAISTDLDDDPEGAQAALAAGHDLLEGLDPRDPMFERWRIEQRQRLAGKGGIPLDLTVADERALPFLIRTGAMPAGFGGFVALALAEAVGKLVSEFATVDIFGPNRATVQIGALDRGMVLGVEASESDGRLHLIATIGSLRTGQMFWSRHARLPLRHGDTIASGEFPGLVFEAAEAALAALPRVIGNDPAAVQGDSIVSRAVREMFSFDAQRLRLADMLLDEAERISPSPRVYAWHSLLKQIMAIERTEPDRDVLLDEAMVYARKAMEGAPSNPLVMSLVSSVQVMLMGDVEGGAALARHAIAMSPNNAFAYAAQAGSLLRQGRAEDAFRAAQTGARLAARSSFLHWWEAMSGLSAVAAGNYPVAVSMYESARSRAPQFRSVLRHLLFLYLEGGQAEKAAIVLRDLQRLEPDFSMHRVREDPDYPAGTLRATRLVALEFPAQAM